MLSLNDSRTLEIMYQLTSFISVFVSKNKLCLSYTQNFHLTCLINITINVTCNSNRFFSSFLHKVQYILQE